MISHSTTPQLPAAIVPPNVVDVGSFVKIAYDVYNQDVNNWNPTIDDYPTLPMNYKVIFNVQMSDFFGSNTYKEYYGFIAQSNIDPKNFIIAIRGTQTLTEWWDDFDWTLTPFPYLQNCGNVANGFLTIYETMVLSLPEAGEPFMKLKDMPNRPETLDLVSSSKLIAAGHSLGSALITLYAGQLSGVGTVNPVVYTYASPRVGDTDFANCYNSLITTNYRIYNWPDLVPDFPKDFFDHYQQVKGGYEIDSLANANVCISLECFHSLDTYLYLLGAPLSILGQCECDGTVANKKLPGNGSN